MVYGYEDSLTLLLMIIGIGLSLYAQFKINGTYGKFKKILNNGEEYIVNYENDLKISEEKIIKNN